MHFRYESDYADIEHEKLKDYFIVHYEGDTLLLSLPTKQNAERRYAVSTVHGPSYE